MPYGIIEDDGYVNAVFPMIRRVYPSLIAKSLVSVQPMSAPTGAVFYMDGYMGSNDWWSESEIQVMIEDSANLSETFVKLIRGHNSKTLIKVIDEKFPQHRELLDKLSILK